MKIEILLLLFFILVISKTLAPKKISTFGLLTITSPQEGDNQKLMSFIKHYAFMDCPLINQISIIWDQQNQMESNELFTEREQWKIPVYLYRNQYTGSYWRYSIQKQIKSEVFFVMNDDILINCQELTKGFEVWSKNAIGNLGPLVIYEYRYFQYTSQRNFQIKIGKSDYFNMGTNLAFVSRHFLQLYYADTWELNELKIQILKKNNCEDVALNFITQYFYPQLPPIFLKANFQKKSQSEFNYRILKLNFDRSLCLKNFIDIFGYNPLRFIPIKDHYPNRQKKLQSLISQIVLAKQKYLNQYILQKTQIETKNNQQISNEKVAEKKLVTIDTPVFIEESQNNLQQNLKTRTKYEEQIEDLVIKQKQLLSQIQTLKKYGNAQQIKTLKQQFEDQLMINKQIIQINYWRSYIQLGFGLLFLYVLWKVCELSFQKQRKKGIRLASNQFQYG